MSQRVAFFDIAGTLISANPWEYILTHPDVSEKRSRSARRRFLPTWLGAKVGIVSDPIFRHRWLHLMAGIFAGWSREQLEALYDWVVVDQMKDAYRSDILERLQQHHADGDHVVLVSGIFGGLSASFARHFGADGALGSDLAFQDDICTGRIASDTCVGPRKLAFIQRYITDNGLSTALSDHFGYADSYSDVPLLEAVGNPAAVYPDSDLRAVAEARGWTILGV